MTSGGRLNIDLKRGAIPLSLFILAVLHYGLGAPLWVLGLFSLWVPIVYILMPWYARRRWEDFDRTFTQHFQRGKHRELLQAYRKEWYLRRFGPQADMLSKLGLIYSALGKYREAEHALEQALDAMGSPGPQQLYFNLANVKFELGKFDDAMQIYLSLRGNSPYHRAARTQMALIDLQKGARVEQARSFLESERPRVSAPMRERIDRALARH
ncbi:hypothetical protein DV096_15580 [Bradymonadaceae bacterium TMQ3]|uniref:Tetratricopeptide repeat protein n=1 Tax=Lujinxingia sediminis TaxID=2480984 RepID=A0ABY0CR41_9DELT|nr:tetratricopeptide repeat protein [Lujinxingia sediminis]RDV36932.1 hypothetical protein DV096_15580 [Bradymonadaceae bacterium TMQ3]RVU42985.1 tetratricopeptide repeat protein [Lujinxingia sediminis]TXC73055.1 tetratricopeptide repeat protein [Bradymonadales bacterium TMQ1]